MRSATTSKPINADGVVCYRVYVEGGLHAEFDTYANAKRRADKVEAEGWSVRIARVHATLIGIMESFV